MLSNEYCISLQFITLNIEVQIDDEDTNVAKKINYRAKWNNAETEAFRRHFKYQYPYMFVVPKKSDCVRATEQNKSLRNCDLKAIKYMEGAKN